MNAITYWFCVYPCTPDEKRRNWVKYRFLGKFVYGLTFLNLEEDRKLFLEKKEGKTKNQESAL